MSAARLERVSTVEALSRSLRERILDGELPPGAPLREQSLSAEYGVARHSLRSALRALDAEGLVHIEANRGARVAALDANAVRGLGDLRTAVEVEAARLALERGAGRLHDMVHRAADRLAAACRRQRPGWGPVAEAHEAFHREIVAAGGSERLAAVHGQAGAELRLFLVQLRPRWTLERVARDHLALPGRIEREGPEVLRPHIRESTETLLGLLGAL